MTERRDDAEEREGPVIRDKRRVDPKGKVREPADKPAPEAAPSAPTAADGEEAADLRKQLAERTLDLQRLQAEYSNYRKRVDRDRATVSDRARATVLNELLLVLDDIGRAREHDELNGGFKQVAERLEATVVKLGLQSFGTPGEPFDPNVHEALMHSYSPDVTEPTAVQILQPGYRIGEQILRPARVAVAEPGGEAEPEEPGPPEDSEAEAGAKPEADAADED